MKEINIVKGISWIGAIDPNLRVFDIIMYTEFGTSYNAYIVEGSEKTALVETVKHTFTDAYIEFLKENKDLTKIDYILVNHTEPDHVGTVAKLLDYTPNAQIIGSASAIKFLKEIANRPFESIVVKEGDEISLGDKTLRFIMAPFLHWPDSIYTYIVEDKVLFTCDSFGAHYAMEDIFYSKIPNMDHYKRALRYYFDMIFGPFKKYMLSAIEKIETLDIDFICNGHGPILDQNPLEIVKICKAWSLEGERKQQITIPYVSAYGYTKELALKIAEGITYMNLYEAKVFDMVYAKEEEVLEAITQSEGVIVGSPTINGDALLPIMNLLVKLSPIVHGGLLAAAFGSYGWSGEAVENLNRRMKELKFKVLQGLRVNFKPTEKDLKEAFEYGQDFVNILTKKEVFVAFDAPKNTTHVIEKDDDEKPIKKWICTICQEVFEGTEAPDICAACGATKDQFEEYIEITHDYSVESDEQVIIIGNGIAGITVAETIRKYSQSTKITLIDKAPHPVYYKPMLSKFIGSEEMPKSFYIHDIHWYERHQIQFLTNRSLESIDHEAKSITLSDGTHMPYDKLVIATGSESFMPPIKNNHLKGVFTLRTLDDAIAIKEKIKTSKKAVVIGGGLLGLEVGAQMLHAGLEVTVVEIMDRILPRQLDNNGSTILEKGFALNEIRIVKGVKVETITGEETVTGIKLEDGQFLEADLILISAGVRSILTPYEEIGIECTRGIEVNAYMETNRKDIYACGDCACFNGMNYAIWPEAVLQGETAGLSILGIRKPYETYVPSTILNAMDLSIFSIGHINVEPEDPSFSTIVYENKEKNHYKSLIFQHDKIIGAIIIGDNKRTKNIIKGIKKQHTLAELMEVFQ
jgi:NADH oxidase (H2O-forming)